MIYLNKNESPYAPFTKDELLALFEQTEIHRYPRDEYQTFVNLYARQQGFEPNQVALANGSDEWIQKINILLPKGKMLVLEPDFTMYDDYAAQFNRPIVKVPVEDDFVINTDALIAAIYREKPAFFIFSQPNNPLGTLYSQEFIDQACQAMKDVGGYCIVDEAYLQYASHKTTTTLEDHVIIFRTFSKIYGMAGLRIGIAISTEKTMQLLNSINHPYPINSLSLTIANTFLENPDKQNQFFNEHFALVEQLKAIFVDELTGIVNMLPSEANYIFTFGKNAAALGDYLFSHGFYPRIFHSKLLEDCVRYSIAKASDLDKLQVAIQNWKATLKA